MYTTVILRCYVRVRFQFAIVELECVYVHMKYIS